MKKSIFALALLFVTTMTALAQQPSIPDPMVEPAYRKITMEEAKQMMEAAEPFILLDVRTEEEFKKQHIEGAHLIPLNALAERADAELPDKEAIILVYCQSGGRSANAAHALFEMGYTNVHDFGGIIDWPYETVSGEPE